MSENSIPASVLRRVVSPLCVIFCGLDGKGETGGPFWLHFGEDLRKTGHMGDGKDFIACSGHA